MRSIIVTLAAAFKKIFSPPALRRIDFKFVSYEEAAAILRSDTRGEWQVAPEEDLNKVLGKVCLERVVPDRD